MALEFAGAAVDIAVTDLDRAEAFYTTLLGRPFDLRARPDQREWRLCASPEVVLRITADPDHAGHGTAAIGVRDLAAEHARLALHWPDLPAVWEKPGVIALLRLPDPDGNAVVLWKDLLSRSGPAQLRLVVTAEDHDRALRFYRDTLGLPQLDDFSSDEGTVILLDAGRATVEIADARQAAFIDRVEVGRRVAGHIRVAFEVADSAAVTDTLAEAGAEVIAPPTRTPWNSLNARLSTPAGLQVTIFAELGE